MSMKAVRWGVLAAACLIPLGMVSAQETKKETLPSISAKDLESAEEIRMQELMQRGVHELSGTSLVELLDRLAGGYRSPNKTTAGLQDELAKNRKALLKAALKVAVDGRNMADFEAVANGIGALGDKELSEQVETLKPLLAKKRSSTMSPLMMPLDDLSLEAIQSYKRLEKAIERCESVGDLESLKEVEFALPLVADLSEAMRSRLAKQLETAKKNIQQPQGEDAEILKTLSKTSRATAAGTLIVDPNGRQTAPPPNITVNLPPGYSAILTKDDAVAIPGTLGITLNTGGNGRPIRSGTPNSWLMYAAGKPLTLVVNGQRIQWATTAAVYFSTEARSRTPLQFEQVPGLGEIQVRADVIQFPGGPAGFVGTGAGGVKMVFATNSSAAVIRNGSTVRSVTPQYWYSLKRGPDLIQNP
ncbi:MAG: hypothetical protein U0744_21170 [Gemmataceae bacterium]